MTQALGKKIADLLPLDRATQVGPTKDSPNYVYNWDKTITIPETETTFDLGNGDTLVQDHEPIVPELGTGVPAGREEHDYFTVYDSAKQAKMQYFTRGPERVVDEAVSYDRSQPGKEVSVAERDNKGDGQLHQRVTSVRDVMSGRYDTVKIETDKSGNGQLDDVKTVNDTYTTY